MRNIKIDYDTIGDKNQFKVIVPLVNELKKNEYKYYARCAALLTKYHELLRNTNELLLH